MLLLTNTIEDGCCHKRSGTITTSDTTYHAATGLPSTKTESSSHQPLPISPTRSSPRHLCHDLQGGSGNLLARHNKRYPRHQGRLHRLQQNDTLAGRTTPTPTEYPFQCICADFFHHQGHNYIVIIDKYSNWPIVERARDGATGLINILRHTFATYGIPDELSSDGGPEFTAHTSTTDSARWPWRLLGEWREVKGWVMARV